MRSNFTKHILEKTIYFNIICFEKLYNFKFILKSNILCFNKNIFKIKNLILPYSRFTLKKNGYVKNGQRTQSRP
jgi:hypothetical protein